MKEIIKALLIGGLMVWGVSGYLPENATKEVSLSLPYKGEVER